MRTLIAPFVIAPLVFGTLPAVAQGNPTADQIINSLKPSGNLAKGGTRGIRLAAPTGDASAAPQPAPVQQQPRLASARPVPVSTAMPATPTPSTAPSGGPTVNLMVNFANGSADLTPDAMRTLDELGKALASKDLSTYRFRIEGHTDTVGSREYNRTLSERRAEAVVAYVARKFGVDPSRLQAIGMGEDGLLVPTPVQTPEPRNRRVEVINLGA